MMGSWVFRKFKSKILSNATGLLSLTAAVLLVAPAGSLYAQQSGNSVDIRALLIGEVLTSQSNVNVPGIAGNFSSEPLADTQIRLVEERSSSKLVTGRRHIQYSEDHLVIAVLDSNGNELFRDVRIDPRLVRAEVPGPDGLLQNRKIYRVSQSFAFSIPVQQGMQSVRIYKPVWTGSRFVFDLVGDLALNP